MDRRNRLLASATFASEIIELGAGYSPIAPKSEGWRTHVVDHASQAELREKYASANVDLSFIEPVDTTWTGGNLDSCLPHALLGRVDVIIASHVLEHLPDLIGFLQSASRIVSPGGCVSIALPDRRYCFDCYKPWPTTGDLLEAHRAGRDRHSLRTRFNQWAYSASMSGQLGWGAHPGDLPELMNPFQAAIDAAKAADPASDHPYEDCHTWHFTPAGFRLAMLELRQLRLIDWVVEGLDAPGSFEFFATLRRSQQSPPDPEQIRAERQTLLIEQLREVAEQAAFLSPAALALPEPATPAAGADQEVTSPPVRRSLQLISAIRSSLRSAFSQS